MVKTCFAILTMWSCVFMSAFFSPHQFDPRGSWSNSQSFPRMFRCKVSAAESCWRTRHSPSKCTSDLQAFVSCCLRNQIKKQRNQTTKCIFQQETFFSICLSFCIHGYSTLCDEMSVVFFLMAEHVDDVHGQLQQLSLETLPLFQRCAFRGELWHISTLLVYTFICVFLKRTIGTLCNVVSSIWCV